MTPLPSGNMTFFFTDIEGSTRLWEADPDAMRHALARHDALLRDIIESSGGRVFKTTGDGFCAVFSSATPAAQAALAAQRALSTSGAKPPMDADERRLEWIGRRDKVAADGHTA